MTHVVGKDAGIVHAVGIGEAFVTANAADVMMAPGLGSCLGVALYDEINRVAAVVHCLLPLSRADPDRAACSPYYFVDTGLVAVLQAMLDAGASRASIVARLVGASHIMDDDGFFQIGERNLKAGRMVLAKNSIPIAGECVGGTAARTLMCRAADGHTAVRMDGKEILL